MYWIIDAKYHKNYEIKIKFNDNFECMVNLEDTIKNDNRKILKELKNIDLFKSFKVDMDTIVWSNGLDLAPEFLRSLSEK